ncbi:hypothetical protein BDM02DRAFT_3126804 [Thelephora ganbajun]|uniref:Uncharacterized protein n=1 Tax=Thelephora ganbajun TaxID=370292 RepID=A0ACB6ZPY7_THEGA|nr:hypothetical protein BDM02DRAFT_3126804 [Thelephora ganbajun]
MHEKEGVWSMRACPVRQWFDGASYLVEDKGKDAGEPDLVNTPRLRGGVLLADGSMSLHLVGKCSRRRHQMGDLPGNYGADGSMRIREDSNLQGMEHAKFTILQFRRIIARHHGFDLASSATFSAQGSATNPLLSELPSYGDCLPAAPGGGFREYGVHAIDGILQVPQTLVGVRDDRQQARR